MLNLLFVSHLPISKLQNISIYTFSKKHNKKSNYILPRNTSELTVEHT